MTGWVEEYWHFIQFSFNWLIKNTAANDNAWDGQTFQRCLLIASSRQLASPWRNIHLRSLTCLEELDIGFHPESYEFRSHPLTFILYPMILPSVPRSPTYYFPLRFSVEILHAFLISPVISACSAHLIWRKTQITKLPIRIMNFRTIKGNCTHIRNWNPAVFWNKH